MLKYLKNIKDKLTGNETVIAIDLGTTNTVVSVLENGVPKIIESSDGKRLTPSVVSYSKGAVLVGQPAVNAAILNPSATIFSAKRFIGKTWEQAKAEKYCFQVPFIVRPGYTDKASFEIDGVIKNPEEVSAEVLRKIKADAEGYLGKSVSRAIITVPAYFNDSQRQATIDAGKIAGLESQIINEPTAAALAYAYDLQGSGDDLKNAKKIAVYDLGGGTYDISILEVSEDEIQVLGVGGNNHLGGDDFDVLLLNYALDEFSNANGYDLRSNVMALHKLKAAVIEAKIMLSSAQEASIMVPLIDGKANVDIKVSRGQFEKMIRPLVESSIEEMRKALETIKMKPAEVDRILLVGGSTRIPLVQEQVKKFFNGREPIKNRGTDEIVSLGAAVYSGIIREEIDFELYDVTSLSLGVKTIGNVMSVIIPKNTRVPVVMEDKFTTVSDNQTTAVIDVYQGESRSATDNHLLGTITLEEIEPRPAGVPRIMISYSIDGNGVLVVSAKDGEREQKITLSNTGKLDRKEIRRAKKEQEMPEKDRQALHEARKELGQEIKRLESNIKHLPEGEKKQTMIARVEEAERVIQEEIDKKDVELTTKEIRKVEV